MPTPTGIQGKPSPAVGRPPDSAAGAMVCRTGAVVVTALDDEGDGVVVVWAWATAVGAAASSSPSARRTAVRRRTGATVVEAAVG